MRFFEVAKFEITDEPTDTFYGQKRLLLKDPNDTLVDISSLISKSLFIQQKNLDQIEKRLPRKKMEFSKVDLETNFDKVFKDAKYFFK